MDAKDKTFAEGEVLSMLKSEIFEDFINNENSYLSVTDAGPLYNPIHDIKVQRDSKLNILITTRSDDDATRKAKEFLAGTVRNVDDAIKLESVSGSQVSINGVISHSSDVTRDYKSGLNVRIENSTAYSIEAIIQNLDKGKYLIEWFENMDDSITLWPDIVEIKANEKTKISLGSSHNEVIMEEIHQTENALSRSCINITVDGFELYISKSLEKADKGKNNSGFILYKGCPSKDVRRKIRNCLSFGLGRPLINIGHSIFSEDWNLVSFEALSSNIMGEAAFNVATLPPAPIEDRNMRTIDKAAFSQLVTSLYSNYQKCNFDHVSWLYWHAVCQPFFTAAVHFGAAIEALQTSYIKCEGKHFETALINTAEWKELRESTLEIISELKIAAAERKILENKFNALNQSPKDIITKRFLNSIGIELNDLETSAWQQRNFAAHGKEIDSKEILKNIRTINILKVIFHRILLRITNGSENYIDYYSIGHPIRDVKESIPNTPGL